jgi:hypothetical protein
MAAESSMESRLRFNTASTRNAIVATYSAVMPALVAGIHALATK